MLKFKKLTDDTWYAEGKKFRYTIIKRDTFYDLFIDDKIFGFNFLSGCKAYANQVERTLGGK